MERFLTQHSVGDRRIQCVCLHGDRKPQERKDNLQVCKEDAFVRNLLANYFFFVFAEIQGPPRQLPDLHRRGCARHRRQQAPLHDQRVPPGRQGQLRAPHRSRGPRRADGPGGLPRLHRAGEGVVPRRVVQDQGQGLQQHPAHHGEGLLHVERRAEVPGRHRGAPGRHHLADREGHEGGGGRVRREGRLREEEEGEGYGKTFRKDVSTIILWVFLFCRHWLPGPRHPAGGRPV